MLDNIALQNKSIMIQKKEKEISVCWKTLQTQAIFSLLKKEKWNLI